MTDDQALEKTNRINMLFDFYEPLLTDKQRTFLKYYFHDDYSLGEIASAFSISRQAVYEHIKRAETTLEDYELKLKLLAKHEQRMQTLEAMAYAAEQLPDIEQARWKLWLASLSELDYTTTDDED